MSMQDLGVSYSPGNTLWLVDQKVVLMLRKKLDQNLKYTEPGYRAWAQSLGTEPGHRAWAQSLGTEPGHRAWVQRTGCHPGSRSPYQTLLKQSIEKAKPLCMVPVLLWELP